MIKLNSQFSILIITLSLSLLPYPVFAHPSFNVNNGLKALEQGDLDRAESNLQSARFEDPDSYAVNYDLGIVSYRKRDYAKSIRFFAKASEVSKTPDERFNAFYNMGNAAFKGYDFAMAVNAYKNALSIKNDYQADYNLKVAEKKLQEMLERMKKEQEQQQNQQNQQQNQDNKQQQNQKGEQNKDKSQNSDSNNSQDQKDNQSQNQQGQDQQKQDGQNNQENQQGQKEEQNQERQPSNENSERNQQASDYDKNESEDQDKKEGQNSKDSQENKEKQNQEQKQASNSEENDEQQNKEQQSSKQNDEQTGSQDNQKEQSAQSSEEQKGNESKNDEDQKEANAPINEEKIAPEEDRRDVKMAEDKGKVSRPEASQKARAMKNIRLNKKDVEAYLKQMEARENEYQKYYRINNLEEKDPSELSPEDLKEWIKIRTRKREKLYNNEQDW